MFNFKSTDKQMEKPFESDNYIYLKVKYDIVLTDKSLLPVKVKNSTNAIDSKTFLIDQNLNYLESLFEIETNSNLKKNNTIYFYPYDEIEVTRTSRFEVNQEFFSSRGVSDNVANKTVDILLNTNKTYDECMSELKLIYKGTFNVEFYNKAIPKLIY
ncbi:hypothetical protein [Spiroplasma sp. BIUS-1]|uniref:hypothetical protein n=1 Tax=Spiroplasma sp. BIUS-1 TaxID=216964 RepID=UPI00139756D0|nr:hypothetical protein [Spiroplasma sp. BIUS-1]QHX36708.1 hypothetical protein SBIUS_v1c04550 [Spiroplasma sp. BIUS-1]